MGGTWIFSGTTHWITRNFLCVPRFLFRNVAVNSSSTVRSDLGVFSVSLLGSSSLISCVSYFCDQSLQSILSMPSNIQGVFLNGSILSDFFTLSALISVGFAVCPSAPSWSAMVSY